MLPGLNDSLNSVKACNHDSYKEIEEGVSPNKDKDKGKHKIQHKAKLEHMEIIDSETPIDVDLEENERAMTQHHLDLQLRSGNTINKKEHKILDSYNKPLGFSAAEIFLRNCPCRSKKLTLKNKFYEKASKKLNYYFDIFTYVKKMQEIDLMKYLLMDKNQASLFNFLCKPSISMTYNDSDTIYREANKDSVTNTKGEELENINQSYKVLKDKNDEVNNRLLYLFDYEIDHLLIG